MSDRTQINYGKHRPSLNSPVGLSAQYLHQIRSEGRSVPHAVGVASATLYAAVQLARNGAPPEMVERQIAAADLTFAEFKAIARQIAGRTPVVKQADTEENTIGLGEAF